MSFQWPWLLWALSVIPLLALAYVVAQRRRAARARTFARAEMMPNVVTASPRWRRHVPALLYVVALTVLILAAARPQRAMSVPRDRATVVLAMDASRSMEATDVAPNRLIAARRAAGALIDRVPRRFQLGVVSFARTAKVLSRPTTDRVAIDNALEEVETRGGTALGDGLLLALETRPPGDDVPMVVVLLSDGNATRGADPLDAARRARRRGVRVFTIGFGSVARVGETPPLDDSTLRAMASAAEGRYFEAPTAADLESVYAEIGSDIATVRATREVTTAFMGAGLLLLVAGGALATLWFSRAP